MKQMSNCWQRYLTRDHYEQRLGDADYECVGS